MSGSDEGGRDRTSSAGEVLFAKTCQTCFSLKIRCDRTQRTDICDRCARLGKQCTLRPARRRDNSAKRDSLLRLQDPTHNAQQPLPAVSEIPTIANTSVPVPSSDLRVPTEKDVIDEGILTMERADILIEIYRIDMMPHFPFVIVPPQDTAQTLRHKSMLFLAILLVANFHDLTMQERLGERFKRMLVDKVLWGGNECLKLEYLQAICVLVAFSHFHEETYTTQYLQMAISIAVDMRLDRKPLHRKIQSSNDKRDPLRKGNPGTQTWGPGEQRAAAGLFYLASSASKLLDKLNVFPCSPTIEEGCLALGRAGEYRTDKDLYHIIRLQRIIEGIEKISREFNTDAEAHDAYLRVRSELEEFRIYMDHDLTDNHCLIMQFHIAKIFLYQVAFFERNLQQSPLLNLSMLCEGLESAKSFLDIYLRLPPKAEMALTLTEWVQLSFGVTQAAKFAIVSKSPNVEIQTRELRKNLNMENLFRHLRLRIGALIRGGGTGNAEKDAFSRYFTRLKKIQMWYEKMSKATEYYGSTSPPSSTLHPSSGTTPSPHQQSPYTSSVAEVSPQSSSEMSFVPPYTHQQIPSYPTGPIHPTSDQLQAHSANVNVMPMGPYASYGSAPTLSFPEFMNAPGWDELFTVPMVDFNWVTDNSPPSANPGWEGQYDPTSNF
ncbi:hypothetical protein DM02DRAFT_527040 [Periconia macrospinosa]|uniref:Zn(2)-C6 fungal-type domain-containing protein n=1 Tax=Periconia macrospinosa TaxID=97972 RepID=A0A2V1DR03_9PLEO|nr:hypothetical protein DM02DRAFT_527040 [Periconia macrospinosa]